MDRTKLEHDLATSESSRLSSRTTLIAIIIALLVITAVFFLNNIYSALSEQSRRIESLEQKVAIMQSNLEKLSIQKNRERE